MDIKGIKIMSLFEFLFILIELIQDIFQNFHNKTNISK